MVRLSTRLISAIFLLILTVSLSLTIALAAEPGAIKGIIKDESGQPVRGAQVVLAARDGRELSTVTDNQGNFIFTNIKPDNYLVKADANGFRALVSPEILLANGEQKDLDLTLLINGINEEVVITAANTAQTVDEVSKSITVIDHEEIEHREEHTIVETLRNEPGTRVRVFGGPGNLVSIRLRGLANEDTAILIDGLRLRDAGDLRGSAQSVSDNLFVDNVERIELLRGSGSSLYGTTAVGGVINIVPYTGVGAPSGEVSFEGGGLGFFREAARIGGSFANRFSYSLGASRTDTNQGIDGKDIYRATNLATSLKYIPSTSFSISGIINYSRSYVQNNDSPFPIGPAGNEFGYAGGFNPPLGFSGPITGFIADLNDPDAFRTTRFLQTGFSVRHRLSEIVGYYGSFNFVRSDRRFFDGPLGSPQLVDLITKAQGFFPALTSDTLFKGRTYTFNGGVNLRVDKHNLATIGVEIEKERLRQNTDFFGKESFAQKTFGFYFQDQLHYFENRLQLSLAGRIQSFDLDTSDGLINLPPADLAKIRAIDVPRAYSGDGSIAYSFFQTGTKLRAHIGNSFRAPSLSERFGAFDSAFQPVRVGNPFLRPERAISADAGIDQSAFHNRLRISLSYFYTRRQEIIIAGFIPFSTSSGAAFSQTNLSGGLSRGFEASVVANPARGLDVSVSYLYTNSEEVFNGARSNGQVVSGGTRAFGIPRQTFNFIVNKHIHNFNFNFDLNAISSYDGLVFSPPELFTGFAGPIFRFDGYVKADLVGSYTFHLDDKRSLEIFGKASNITDEKYFEDGFKTPGATGSGGVRFRF